MSLCILNITENCALSGSQCTVPGVISQRTASYKCHQQSADICPPKCSQTIVSCLHANYGDLTGKSDCLVYSEHLEGLGHQFHSPRQLMFSDVLLSFAH